MSWQIALQSLKVSVVLRLRKKWMWRDLKFSCNAIIARNSSSFRLVESNTIVRWAKFTRAPNGISLFVCTLNLASVGSYALARLDRISCISSTLKRWSCVVFSRADGDSLWSSSHRNSRTFGEFNNREHHRNEQNLQLQSPLRHIDDSRLSFFFIFGNDSHLEILSELAWRASQKLHRENNENYINDNGSSASSGIEFTRVSFTFLLAFVSIREWKNAKIWKCAKQFLFFLSFFLFSLRFFRIAIIVERKATEKWPSYINRLTLCVLSFSCQSSSLSRRWWCFHDDAELFQSLFDMQLIQFSGRNLQLVSE